MDNKFNLIEMKKVYLVQALLLLGSVFFLPNQLLAQCECAGACANGIQDVNQSSSGELFCAVSYLCSEGVLDEDDGFFEPDENIIREDVAKTIYIGLLGSATMASVTDSFPTPFADLQGNWIEYYKYAKAMSYLEYEDGISVFDRVFYNFRPGDEILRAEIAKAYVEAFNLTKSTNTTPYYSDVPDTHPLFVYVQTMADEGFIDPATNFRPDDLTKRGEAFLMLYRILCGNTYAIPTDDDYFMPGNYHTFNLNNKPSLSDANFDAYSKTSFNIPGKNIPLVFAHNYNSHLTELPDALFPICPMGRGWSHSYNSYIVMQPGYNNSINSIEDRYIVFWPGGSMYDFSVVGGNAEPNTRGVYDEITYTTNRVTIKKKNQMVYIFEKVTGGATDPFVLKAIRDRNNNTVQLNYQAGTTNISEVVGTAGRKLTFDYISVGNVDLLSCISDPIGRKVSFSYDMATFDCKDYTDAENKVTTYLYGSTMGERHLLKNITLPNGNTIDNEYENRKLTSTRTNNASTGQQINTTVDFGLNNGVYAGSNSMMMIDDGSSQREYEYLMNGQGNLKSMDTPTNTINDVQYTSPGNPNLPSSVMVDMVPTSYVYDLDGNVREIHQPQSVSHYFTYTAKNDIDVYTNPRGFDTDFNYDGNGNLKQIITPIGTTTMNYNPAGQPTSIINPEGITVSFGYNAFGNQNMVTAPGGIISGATYDGASRLIESVNPNSQTTNYEYNPRDFITKTTDALSHETQFRYDDNGNLVEIENAKNEITTLGYDDNDFLRTETFGGFTKSYDYDDEGKLIKLTKPDGTELDYTYDPVTGNLLNDDYATYTYDGRNRLKTVTKNTKTITYEYDDLNRIIWIEYDGDRVSYGYDANSNVTSLTYPDGQVVTYTYDAKDRMETVTDWNGATTTYEYWDDDRLKITYLPNGTSYDYEYDAAGRVEKLINYRNGGTPWIRYIYGMDKNGNHLVEEKIDEPFGYPAAPTESFTYAYNSINRIESATGDMGTSTNWTFDNNGNTLTKGATTYAWDTHDMLTNYNDGADNLVFQYDGLGNRREATRNLITFEYTLDILGMSRVLEEKDGSGNVRNYYVYGLGLISNVKPDGSTFYYHYDFRGSVMAMTDEAQNVTHTYNYDEYGQLTDMTEAHYNPFRYVGKYGVMYETDELMFMRARYYDPSIGRFLSEDPIWSTNLYPYVDGNPITFVDITGLTPYHTKETLEYTSETLSYGSELYDIMGDAKVSTTLGALSDAAGFYSMVTEVIEKAEENDTKGVLIAYGEYTTTAGIVAVTNAVSSSNPVTFAVSVAAPAVVNDVSIIIQDGGDISRLDEDGSFIWKGSQAVGDGIDGVIDNLAEKTGFKDWLIKKTSGQ